jgi:hypothetical protein
VAKSGGTSRGHVRKSGVSSFFRGTTPPRRYHSGLCGLSWGASQYQARFSVFRSRCRMTSISALSGGPLTRARSRWRMRFRTPSGWLSRRAADSFERHGRRLPRRPGDNHRVRKWRSQFSAVAGEPTRPAPMRGGAAPRPTHRASPRRPPSAGSPRHAAAGTRSRPRGGRCRHHPAVQ